MTGYARLEADGLDPFELTDDEGFAVAVLDLGFPLIRTVSDTRSDADGEVDRTRLFGARAVTLSGTVLPTDTRTRQEVLDRLGAFLNPRGRAWLIYRLEDGSTERRIRLVPAQRTAPIARPGSAKITVGWRGPDGVEESTTVTQAAAAATPDVEPGMTFPLTFPLTFPESSPVGAVTITNPGNVAAYPTLRLFGPVTGPRVENQTTGARLVFPDLSIPAGDYLEIDTRAKSILLNGESSRYNELDFAVSSWLDLEPGENVLRYYPTSFGDGAEATVRFRAAWI